MTPIGTATTRGYGMFVEEPTRICWVYRGPQGNCRTLTNGPCRMADADPLVCYGDTQCAVLTRMHDTGPLIRQGSFGQRGGRDNRYLSRCQLKRGWLGGGEYDA